MTDEEYVFHKDNADKAITARSAHNKSGTKKAMDDADTSGGKQDYERV